MTLKLYHQYNVELCIIEIKTHLKEVDLTVKIFLISCDLAVKK